MSTKSLLNRSVRTPPFFVAPERFQSRGCLYCAIYCRSLVQTLIERVIASMDSPVQKKSTSSKNSTYTRVSPSKWAPEKPSSSNAKRSQKSPKPSPSKSSTAKPSKTPVPIALPKNASNADRLEQDAAGHPVDSSSIIPVKELTKRLQDRMDGVDPPSVSIERTPDLENKTEARVDSPVSSEEDKENDVANVDTGTDHVNDSKTDDGKIDDSKTIVMFEWSHTAPKQVFLAGSFNDWSDTSCPLKLVDDVHRTSVPLESGKYLFKFVVDGEWHYDITLPTETDVQGNVNNVLMV